VGAGDVGLEIYRGHGRGRAYSDPNAEGTADGPVKRAIFGENSAKLYRYDRRAELSTDRIAIARATYEREGPGRTNRRYGYVTPPIA
jgi:hypothetical protein